MLTACGSAVTAGDVPAPDEVETTATAEVEVSPSTTKPPPPATIGTTTTAASGGSQGASGATTTATPATTTAPPDPSGDFAVPDEILAIVVAAASSSQGVSAASIEVVSAVAGDWPDGSLGCPEPGKSYTQVLVPGYLVILSVGGTEVE